MVGVPTVINQTDMSLVSPTVRNVTCHSCYQQRGQLLVADELDGLVGPEAVGDGEVACLEFLVQSENGGLDRVAIDESLHQHVLGLSEPVDCGTVA